MLDKLDAVTGNTPGERRRAQIIDVAASLFQEYGYHETPLAAIAEGVGIRKASLYYHFKSKDQILVTLHEGMIEPLLENQRRRVADEEMSAPQLLLAMMSDLIGLMEDQPGRLRIFIEHYRGLPDEVRVDIADKRDRYRQMMVEVLRAGVATGEFADIDPELTSFAILGVCHWTYQWFRPGGSLTARQVAEYFWRLQLAGIAGPKTGADVPPIP